MVKPPGFFFPNGAGAPLLFRISLWMVSWPGFHVFVSFLLDVLHQFVIMAIASLLPLFS